jgi:hypothetical protein
VRFRRPAPPSERIARSNQTLSSSCRWGDLSFGSLAVPALSLPQKSKAWLLLTSVSQVRGFNPVAVWDHLANIVAGAPTSLL